MPLPQAVVDEARGIVASLTETAYQYHQSIDATAGVFLCDCSEFVSFVLSVAAPEQLALIKPEAHQPVPRAFVYCDYFQNLPATSDKGWQRIDTLADAVPGDILAWRFSDIEAGHDTGHVMVIAAVPDIDPAGNYAVRVCDCADVPHFDDSRPSDKGCNGVGTGIIYFQVDPNGRPIAFLFGPGATGYVDVEIRIGRVEPI